MSTIDLTPAGHFTLGVAADVGAIVITQPVDTLKTYMMSGRGWPPLTHLWKGTLANCAGALVNGGGPFLINAVLQQSSWHTNEITTGALTGLLCSFGVTPFERVAKMHQLQGGSVQNAYKMACLSGGVFKALTPIATRDILVWGTFFGLRKTLDKPLQKMIPHELTRQCCLSFTMGVGAGALSYFPDKVSIKMNGDLVGRYPTTWKTIQATIQESNRKTVLKEMAVRSLFMGSYMLALGWCASTLSKNMPTAFHMTKPS